MPKNKVIIDDVGSTVLRELVEQVDSIMVYSAPATTGAVTSGNTGYAIILLSQEDLVVDDVLISNAVALTNAATDLFVEHDTDQAFTTATIVLDVQGFNAHNLAAGSLTLGSEIVGDAVATQTFPFILPANSALRLRFVNTEGTNRTLLISAKYHPKSDRLTLVPDISTTVLSSQDR